MSCCYCSRSGVDDDNCATHDVVIEISITGRHGCPALEDSTCCWDDDETTVVEFPNELVEQRNCAWHPWVVLVSRGGFLVDVVCSYIPSNLMVTERKDKTVWSPCCKLDRKKEY